MEQVQQQPAQQFEQLTVEQRRNRNAMRMAMVKIAGLNIKALFPMLRAGLPKTNNKNPSHTKKGSGRYHKQGK